MAVQTPDGLASFFMPNSPEVNPQATHLTFVRTSVEEDLALPVLLFETNKDLFDLALESGFRLLGAE
jgi:hypothetical protein